MSNWELSASTFFIFYYSVWSAVQRSGTKRNRRILQTGGFYWMDRNVCKRRINDWRCYAVRRVFIVVIILKSLLRLWILQRIDEISVSEALPNSVFADFYWMKWWPATVTLKVRSLMRMTLTGMEISSYVVDRPLVKGNKTNVVVKFRLRLWVSRL